MECSICMENIKQSAIASCAHHFCYTCLIKWCEHNMTCPKCRMPIREIRRDSEFDLLVTSASSSSNASSDDNTDDQGSDCSQHEDETAADTRVAVNKVLKIPSGTFAGMRLCNARDGPGLMVSALLRRDQGTKCGFKVGDLITSMNGVPCVHHEQSIKLINEATRASSDVTCVILSKAATSRSLFPRVNPIAAFPLAGTAA